MGSWSGLEEAALACADSWRGERAERLTRTSLDPADFAALREAGYLLGVVPTELGGLWERPATSARPLCEVLRTLAGGDGAVALVAAMHPAVLGFWLLSPDPDQPAWEAQRRAVFESAVAGNQWGTITSEPGSGGDIAKTKAEAVPDTDGARPLVGEPFLVTGDKHFGSGSGITQFMMTTARRDGADEPDIYALDVRDRPWDGTAGLRLLGAWDGMGMAATQSHAMRLEGAPATRAAWGRSVNDLVLAAAPLNSCLFTAVVLGILDEAVASARERLAPRAQELRAYEQVEWTRAEAEHWLAQQAYEGALRAFEAGAGPEALHAALRGKAAVAELAEQVLLRLTRVLGGGTYSRRSPFAHWFEDVRALGFLRPPWALASDGLFLTSFG